MKNARYRPHYLSALVYRLYSGLFLERLATRAVGGRRQDASCALQYIREAERHLHKCDLSDPDRKHDQILVLNNLGRLLLEGKRYEEAKPCFQDILDAMREGPAEKASLESYVLNNLGEC